MGILVFPELFFARINLKEVNIFKNSY